MANEKASVAIFGEVLADVFPDQTVLGGAPFNVARHLQAFGAYPMMISRTGEDALGAQLRDNMRALGMPLSGMQQDAQRPTGQVRVTLDGAGHRFEILPDQAYDHLCPEATRQLMRDLKPALAYFGTLAQRQDSSRRALQAMLEDCECPLFLDINLRAPWYDADVIASSLHAADIVKLNDEELAVIADLFGLASMAPEAQARALQQRFALRQVLVTCGAAGSWMLDLAGQVWRASPAGEDGPLVDTVGAGDAYAAVFLLGLLHGWDVPETLQRASVYAAAICRVRGAAPDAETFFEPYRRAWRLGG